MTDQAKPTISLDKLENNSSIFEKTSPDLRRRVNQAIADRSPATHKGIYEKFNLAAHGISLSAFYRYARRLRTQCALFEITDCIVPDDVNIPAELPRLFAARLLEALVLDEPSPRSLQRLADAYRIATEVHLNLRKHASLREKAREKDTGMLYKVMQEYRQIVARDMETQLLQKNAALDMDSDESRAFSE